MLFLPTEPNGKNRRKFSFRQHVSFSGFENRSKLNFKRKRTELSPEEENHHYSFAFDSKNLSVKSNKFQKKKPNRIGRSKLTHPNLSVDSNFLSPKTEFHLSQSKNIQISQIPQNIEHFYASVHQNKVRPLSTKLTDSEIKRF